MCTVLAIVYKRVGVFVMLSPVGCVRVSQAMPPDEEVSLDKISENATIRLAVSIAQHELCIDSRKTPLFICWFELAPCTAHESNQAPQEGTATIARVYPKHDISAQYLIPGRLWDLFA